MDEFQALPVLPKAEKKLKAIKIEKNVLAEKQVNHVGKFPEILFSFPFH